MNGQSEPAPTSIPSKMDDMWTANAFSLYSCHTLNHGLTIHTHLPTYPPTYLPTSHQLPHPLTYVHRDHLHSLPTNLQ
jgi:hypothetical protein